MLARGGACAGAARSVSEQISALEDAPEERARLAQLAGDLSELPVVQRSALLMRELTGMRHAEIANALGISRPAVRQSIFLARRSLSEFQLGRSLACEQVCRTLKMRPLPEIHHYLDLSTGIMYHWDQGTQVWTIVVGDPPQ